MLVYAGCTSFWPRIFSRSNAPLTTRGRGPFDHEERVANHWQHALFTDAFQDILQKLVIQIEADLPKLLDERASRRDYTPGSKETR